MDDKIYDIFGCDMFFNVYLFLIYVLYIYLD